MQAVNLSKFLFDSVVNQSHQIKPTLELQNLAIETLLPV